jgi:hypothetical protein
VVGGRLSTAPAGACDPESVGKMLERSSVESAAAEAFWTDAPQSMLPAGTIHSHR